MTTAARGCVKGRGSCAGAERRLWLKPRRLGGLGVRTLHLPFIWAPSTQPIAARSTRAFAPQDGNRCQEPSGRRRPCSAIGARGLRGFVEG